MLDWEIEECHAFDPVFFLAQRRLGVFRLIGFDEQIERLLRVHLVLGLPDIVDRGFGFWLK